MATARIPQFIGDTFVGMQWWFAALIAKKLLFHPDDSPCDIMSIQDAHPVITPEECIELEHLLDGMFATFEDRVYEAAYPVFMNAAGLRLDA